MATTTELSELTGDYVLDTARTRIGFVARHTMATRVRGRFEEFEGGAYLDGDHPSMSSARLTMRTAGITTGNPPRDNLLRAKFLDMDDHPAITFATTGVEQSGETTFKVTGDLTVRGVTRPVTVDFELTGVEDDQQGGTTVRFNGGATIKRRDWGANWNASTTAMVGPKVKLEIEVTATRRI